MLNGEVSNMMNPLIQLRDRLDQLGVDRTPKNTSWRNIFNVRDNEPDYAKLYDPKVEKSCSRV